MGAEHRDPLDRLLDDALEVYAAEEPRPGIEGRVLSRIRAEGRHPRFPFFRWALPVAALAALTAGVILWRSVWEPVSPPAVVREKTHAPAPVAGAEPPDAPGERPTLTDRVRRPKYAQFPKRTPLTRQERALLAFVNSAPAEALQLGDETRLRIEPLRVGEIQVQPLPMGDGSE